jgi:hypothetical protein
MQSIRPALTGYAILWWLPFLLVFVFADRIRNQQAVWRSLYRLLPCAFSSSQQTSVPTIWVYSSVK